MFSSRPDLVIPTAPPRSPPSPGPLDPCGDDEDDEDEEEEDEEEEEEEEEEQGRGKRVKLEEESGGGGGGVAGAKVARNKFRVLPPAWSRGEEEEEEEGEPGGHAGGLEADDETLFRIPGSDAVVSSAPEEADDKAAPDLTCRVCSLRFETRRGLSSHARSHLRQLGVSEGSGAPINLLYRVIQERLGPPDPAAPGRDPDLEDDMDFEEKPLPLSILAKMAPSPSPSSSLTSVLMGPPGAYPPRLLSSVVRKAPVSSLLPVSSPLRSPDHKGSGVKAVTSHLSLAGTAPSTKPFWAPQESDAPLNLTLEGDPSKDIICHLCGAWFETRKGLSSHARAHLRHFGVEYSESKGSPITLLNQLIHTDDFKHKASVLQATPPGPQGPASKRPLLASSSLLFKGAGGSPSSKATSMSSLLGPSAKRPKSSIQVFRLSSGELLTLPHSRSPSSLFLFLTLPPPLGPVSPPHSSSSSLFLLLTPPHNRSSASSLFLLLTLPPPHSSSSSLLLTGYPPYSPRSCCLPPDEPPKEIGCEFCGEFFENRKGLSSHARSHLRQMGITEWSVNGSPIDTLREVIAKRGLPCALPLKPRKTPPPPHPPAGCRTSRATPPSAPPLSSSGGVVLKPKPEPEPLEVTMPGAVGASGGLPTEPPREIQCEFCGEFFENRKGLSSHARSHLRQMGITEWSVNGSPIDTLREVMTKRGDALPPDRGVKKEAGRRGANPVQNNNLFILYSPPFSPGPRSDASCELCGFYFENRKALASHARAHLRQFGVTEWCVNGSPIETLSAWMRTRPQKVLEMHRSYMQVNRSSLKKVPPPPFRKNVSPLSPSSDHLISIPALKPSSSSTSSGSSPWSSLAPPRLPRSDRSEFLSPPLHATPKAGPGGRSPSRQGPGLPLHAQVARSELNVRLPRGFERRPLKHPSLPEGAERESAPRPPRSGTIPSLVPHPPSYPLVKLVGALYTLKCRFCEVEFQGPLSIQEDWIRHLQQHIIKMNYSKPDGPRGPASTDPPTPRGPASTDPPTPRGPVSTDPTTPKGPASTDLATPRGPASTDPTPPRGPASTDPPTPRGSASSDTKTPKGPTSNGPAPPSGLSSPQPATLRAPGSTDPPTHRGATDPPTQQPPASTDSAPPGGPRSTHPAVPRAPPPPSPPAAPHSAQAEGLSAGAPAQDEEGSSVEEGPIPDGGPPACVSTSSTAAAVAPPSDPPSQRPPAQGAPTVPGPQGPEFPEEQPMTDSAPAPAPGPAP
uniref:C2H2-type domain-containing protein n=1 Tax=Gadus morhua TaxID=8049 RepID=A0A8C5CZ23_GADMO